MRFTQPSLDLIDGKIRPVFECDFRGNRYLHGNDIQNTENQNFVRVRYVFEKLMPIAKSMLYGMGNMQG